MFTTSKLKIAMTALIATGVMSAGAVYAQDSEEADTRAESPVVIERGSDGRATEVRVDETVYRVCGNERQDNCIQPRAAGLGWGNRPLQHWPGRPASQLRDSTEMAAAPES